MTKPSIKKGVPGTEEDVLIQLPTEEDFGVAVGLKSIFVFNYSRFFFSSMANGQNGMWAKITPRIS